MVSEQERNIAVASYVTPAGWVVAMILRELSGDYSRYTAFHLRQGLGLSLLEVLVYLLVNKVIDEWIVTQLFAAFLFVSALQGLGGALKGLMRPQILFGRLYDKMFSFISFR